MYGGENNELSSSMSREGDLRVDTEDRDQHPADDCLAMLALLPGRIDKPGAFAVNERERNARRGDEWREIDELKPGEELTVSRLDADLGGDGEHDTGKQPSQTEPKISRRCLNGIPMTCD